MFQSCPSHSFSVQQFVLLNTGLEIEKSAAWGEQQEMLEYNFFSICIYPERLWASLVAQMIRNLPAMLKTEVRSLAGEDPLEKGMATHSSILAWRIPWTEEPDGLQSMESQRIGDN